MFYIMHATFRWSSPVESFSYIHPNMLYIHTIQTDVYCETIGIWAANYFYVIFAVLQTFARMGHFSMINHNCMIFGWNTLLVVKLSQKLKKLLIFCWGIYRRWEMSKKKILQLAKGFRGRAKNCILIARERVEKALQYSYRDSRNKKRDMWSLWI